MKPTEQIVAEAHAIGMMQDGRELAAALGFLRAFRPAGLQNFMEIGCYRGATFHAWAQLALPESKMIAIDNFQMKRSPHGPVIEEELQARVETCGKQARLIKGNSTGFLVQQEARLFLGDDQLDWLFIDSLHHFAHGMREVEMYAPLVRPGGFIGFHDIGNGSDTEITTPMLWASLPNKCFYCTLPGNRGGIGIVQCVRRA